MDSVSSERLAPEADTRSKAEKREERRAERREAILRGAVRVFAERGFFYATIAEIARAAEVAEGTIYLYFKSKDDLLLTIFDERMAQLCTTARAAIDGVTSASEALRRVVVLQLQAVTESPSLAAVLIMELRQSAAFVRDAEKPRLTEYLNLLGDIIRQGQQSGEFRTELHPGLIKRGLFGALDEVSHGWLVARHKFDLVDAGRVLVDLYIRGLEAR